MEIAFIQRSFCSSDNHLCSDRGCVPPTALKQCTEHDFSAGGWQIPKHESPLLLIGAALMIYVAILPFLMKLLVGWPFAAKLMVKRWGSVGAIIMAIRLGLDSWRPFGLRQLRNEDNRAVCYDSVTGSENQNLVALHSSRSNSREFRKVAGVRLE